MCAGHEKEKKSMMYVWYYIIIIITFMSLSTKYQQCYVLLANIKEIFYKHKKKNIALSR